MQSSVVRAVLIKEAKRWLTIFQEQTELSGRLVMHLYRILLYVFVALFAIATVIPFLYVLAGSFATEQELTEKSFFLFPTVFSTMHILTCKRWFYF